ncbi:uncharacterized protein SETTUDRAFT_90043 [Exserohilum turcica Et28A]|uniref:Uncharacterized protein n=1 Tax=Exserohilum turcicum (strain 28A) TaxID=671987 RepID=R0IJY0_EXST2|nr:uncharacterized protein SETTUDRAFT_90043 [Exserohilum turcica Et28A]EOA85435.1 hypothetical protein SETTUDRAFT_90043 [Exserohilum turcica Et28A]
MPAEPSFSEPWAQPSTGLPSALELGTKTWTTLAALAVPLLFCVAALQYRKMQQRQQKPFPFLDLPQELRDMVYEYFLHDPVYPAPAPVRPTFPTSSLDWMKPGRWTTATTAASASPPQPGSKWLFLANKQIYAEYMDMLCKRKTFHFNVSPETYKPMTATPPTPNPSTPPSAPPSSLAPLDTNVWNISPRTLSKIHTCSLKLVTTSSMLGVTDPRSMTSSSWTLGQRMRSQLKHMSAVHTFTLDAKALGDPLWNPLWIWYHASQSLKLLGTDLSDTVPRGPQLTQITFSLDTWSPGENHLRRHAKDGWFWFCNKGHRVVSDGGADMTVREFCAKLYMECSICWVDQGGQASN